MKHIKLFENFEIVQPIPYGEPLNGKEINFLKGYNVMCPEFIKKDDNYYYIFDHRCENIKDVPLTYINAVCKKYEIKNYTINDNYDYSIDVYGGVFISGELFSKIPLKFNEVRGYFNCAGNKLTTLLGSPEYVGGSFDCQGNKLTTLLGGPKYVGSNFDCSDNNLTTLEGGPEYVGRYFICCYNNLTSFKYTGVIKGEIIY